MWLMVFAGAVALVFGIIFLFFPHKLSEWSEKTTRATSQIDSTILQYRIGSGLCLIAVGMFCIISAYYVWIRLH